MPLTPEDVSNKRFTPVRLREGYDMGEVDQFLDEVEAELARLTRENDDLRSKLSAAQSGAAGPGRAPEPPLRPGAGGPARARAGARARPRPCRPRPRCSRRRSDAVAAGVETIRVETVGDASNAAARLLELASRNADQLVEDAKSEADKIIGEARTKAERLESEAKTNADKMEADARGRAQCSTARRPSAVPSCSATSRSERDTLSGEVDNLRAFEREYRSRLKTYFSQQLEALESSGSADPSAPSTTAVRPARSGCARCSATTRPEPDPHALATTAGTPRGAGRPASATHRGER